MKNDEKKSLLEQEIEKRTAAEKKLVRDPQKEKDHGRLPQIIIGVLIAIIALSGLIYPLLH
ncbi:hypothetical protein [Lacticaseibacillus songhuajiangensis]|uniref:hypothetical protein n=1 Tax=Lacticaseibacillus songhuajiangensis TaxID=1296539 RepID=UPI000F77F9BB|nr:hypothetical protein [Lacticaseibacillus songhuajiangensis]